MGRVIELLNGDILREFQTADACLREVNCLSGKDYPVLRRQIAMSAAAALRNATSLAGEVLALGGIPIVPCRPKPQARPASITAGWYPGTSHEMLAHYRRRLRMAERLGLWRLQEVFEEILTSKERHLAHIGLVRNHGPASGYTC